MCVCVHIYIIYTECMLYIIHIYVIYLYLYIPPQSREGKSSHEERNSVNKLNFVKIYDGKIYVHQLTIYWIIEIISISGRTTKS